MDVDGYIYTYSKCKTQGERKSLVSGIPIESLYGAPTQDGFPRGKVLRPGPQRHLEEACVARILGRTLPYIPIQTCLYTE